MAYLEFHTTEGKRRVELNDAKVTIGRHADNTVELNDRLASRRHCEIERTPEGYLLRDLDSRNGTVMGGLRVVTVALRSGAEFSIGNTKIRFVDESQPADLRPDDDGAPESWGEADLAGTASPYSDPSDMFTFEQEPGPAMTSPNYGIGNIETLATVGRDVAFDMSDVSLINARGQTVHAARDTADPKARATADSIRLLRLLLYGAIRAGASDLHVEPKRVGGLLRMRIDGAMVEVAQLDTEATRRLMSLVKVLADIDITKRAEVQEGHFSAQASDRHIDYRVSFTPSMFGQKLVLRVLDPLNAPQLLRDLHLPEWMYNAIRDVSRQDTGMLLCCGPTGSGKTTTIYSVLRQIDARMRNVITIEDPVEYQIDGVTQIPVNDDQGQSFVNLLRSVLRQDPDVIVLGEIRDRETATTAMQAANTGHLVLTTVHAKDTIGAIFRLLDLGVEPYLVASTLNLVLAQRLARVLCEHCKIPKTPTPPQVMRLGKSVEGIQKIYAPAGCKKCFGTGYFGRRGVFELLNATDELRDVILKNPDISGMRKALKMTMYATLREAGHELIRKGVTSFEEIDRVIGADAT